VADKLATLRAFAADLDARAGRLRDLQAELQTDLATDLATERTPT
jgi:hypothetical protein